MSNQPQTCPCDGRKHVCAKAHFGAGGKGNNYATTFALRLYIWPVILTWQPPGRTDTPAGEIILMGGEIPRKVYENNHYLQALIMELREYSPAQLALRNGQDKPEVWVAFQGIIYEVTGSRLWRGGKHYEHWAGQDLTDELPDAPHTERVFEKFNVIGKLKR